MTVSETPRAGEQWARKHDLAGHPRVPSGAIVIRPKTLEDVIRLCRDHTPGEGLHASGSHWSLSDAAVSDHTFVETHDPSSRNEGLSGVLREVIPGCVSEDYVARLSARRGAAASSYPFHFAAGTRIYEAYSVMDYGDAGYPDSLAHRLQKDHGNADYMGSWAFPTMGGAAGQTLAGAVMTGTHGGDFTLLPLADAVVAAHIVVDGGRHAWVERAASAVGPVLTDPRQLRSLYGQACYGGADAFDVIYDDDTLNAVVTSVGRMGIIFSMIVEAVPQFCLHESRRLSTWQEVATHLGDPDHELYHDRHATSAGQRFLQVAVSLTPSHRSPENVVGITKRWNAKDAIDPTTGDLAGRAERRGKLADPQRPLSFVRAGNSHPYNPDPVRPNTALPASLLVRASQSPNLIVGAAGALLDDIDDALRRARDRRDGRTPPAEGGDGPEPDDIELAAMRAGITGAVPWTPLRDENQLSLGELMEVLRAALLDVGPWRQAVGLRAWRTLANHIFVSQQSAHDFAAVSYAVMDGADYLDISGAVNVESMEVFFDATGPALIPFVDGLIDFERSQEEQGAAFVGYASLRFTGPTAGLLGPQLWRLTCSVEVSGLADIDGTSPLIEHAEALARRAGDACILHWGQRNDSTAAEVQTRLGQERLLRWRRVLGRMTSGGTKNAFSTEFTRRLGLEPSENTRVAPRSETDRSGHRSTQP